MPDINPNEKRRPSGLKRIPTEGGTCKNCGNPKNEHDDKTGRCGPQEA